MSKDPIFAAYEDLDKKYEAIKAFVNANEFPEKFQSSAKKAFSEFSLPETKKISEIQENYLKIKNFLKSINDSLDYYKIELNQRTVIVLSEMIELYTPILDKALKEINHKVAVDYLAQNLDKLDESSMEAITKLNQEITSDLDIKRKIIFDLPKYFSIEENKDPLKIVSFLEKFYESITISSFYSAEEHERNFKTALNILLDNSPDILGELYSGYFDD